MVDNNELIKIVIKIHKKYFFSLVFNLINLINYIKVIKNKIRYTILFKIETIP